MPAVIACTPVRTSLMGGIDVSVVVPSPSWPSLFRPQHRPLRCHQSAGVVAASCNGLHASYDYMYAREPAYSIRIHGSSRDEIHGYVKKSSDLGKQLFARLQDAKQHRAILEQLYKDTSRDSSIATIAGSFLEEAELDNMVNATRDPEE